MGVMYYIREDLFSIRKENEQFESANFSLYLVFILIIFSFFLFFFYFFLINF